ncbi:MAG: GNAT family N-acetyltransferase [Pseudomonadota bacterium]
MNPNHASVSLITSIDDLWVRTAKASDIDDIHGLIAASRDHLTQHDDYHDLVAASRSDIAAGLALDDQQQFVMRHKDTVIGTVSLIQYQPTVFGLGYWIGAAFVGKGFTGAAVDTVVQHAISNRKATEVWAGIKHVNTPSIRLVTRLGFKLAREQDTHLSYCLTVETNE